MIVLDPTVVVPIAIDAIAVLGVYIVVNSGRIPAGHAAFVGLGSYGAAVSARELEEAPFWLAGLLGILLATLIGILFASIVERLRDWFWAISTLAFTMVATGLIRSSTFLGESWGIYSSRNFVGLTETLAVLGAAIAAVWLYDRSHWGLESRAVRDNEIAAEGLGIDARMVHLRAFAVGAALAGAAGVMKMGYLGFVRPEDLSFHLSLLFLVYLTVGGSKSILGVLLGTTLLGVAPEVFRVAAAYRLELYGILVVLVLRFRPSGLIPGFSRRVWRQRQRHVPPAPDMAVPVPEAGSDRIRPGR